MASRLDEIAVALTAPMSRRRAMRLTLGAAATAYLGLPAGRASAQRPCKRTPVCEPGTRVCVASRPDGCPGCCTPSEKCCVGAPDNANTACCDEAFGYDCGPLNFYGTPSCACKPENTCQGINDPICCRPEEKCIVRGGQEPVCCKQPCGKEECCYENEDCVMGERLAPDTDFCAKPCGAGQFHCPGSGKCCDHNEECCGDGCCSGKCCRGGGSRWCCPGSLVCGSSPGSCGCPGGHRCGEDCCPAGSECCRLSFSTDILKRFGGPRIGAARYSCCSPGLEKELLDGLESLPAPPVAAFFASSASGASTRRQRGRVAASPGSSEALDALAGVANLAALASDRFHSGRPDSRYRRSVRARRLALAPISPGPGIDATAAQALNKLLSAEARAWTLVDAAAQAHARSLGAIRAHNAGAAVSQARASGRFSAQAAKALRPLPGLRKAAATALQSAGTPEVTVSARQVLAFQNSVRRGGLPADLRARLNQLGLGSSDQKRIRALILGREPERVSGSILIRPLADASTRATLGKLAKLFARRAAHSRKQPIAVSKAGPRTVRGTSPRRHTSQSLRRR